MTNYIYNGNNYTTRNLADSYVLDKYMEIKDGVLLRYMGNDENLVISDSVTEIAYTAFMEHNQFESIIIPKTLISITDKIAEQCKAKRIDVDKDNPKYYSKDGCLIDKETNTIVWCYSGCVIPKDEMIKKIGNSEFANREDISDIVIPNGVEEIGISAFNNCINLETIHIPGSVLKIGNSAFCGCENLTEIKLPSSISSIDHFTFFNCSNLTTLYLPDSLQVIESGAFCLCDKLKEIDLPEYCLKESKTYLGEQLIKENNVWNIKKHKKTFADFKF